MKVFGSGEDDMVSVCDGAKIAFKRFKGHLDGQQKCPNKWQQMELDAVHSRWVCTTDTVLDVVLELTDLGLFGANIMNLFSFLYPPGCFARDV